MLLTEREDRVTNFLILSPIFFTCFIHFVSYVYYVLYGSFMVLPLQSRVQYDQCHGIRNIDDGYLVFRHARRRWRLHKSPIERRWGLRWYAMDSAASLQNENGPFALRTILRILFPHSLLHIILLESPWRLPARVERRITSTLISLCTILLKLCPIFHRRVSLVVSLPSLSSDRVPKLAMYLMGLVVYSRAMPVTGD